MMTKASPTGDQVSQRVDTQVESWATGGEGRENVVYNIIIIIIITSTTSKLKGDYYVLRGNMLLGIGV